MRLYESRLHEELDMCALLEIDPSIIDFWNNNVKKNSFKIIFVSNSEHLVWYQVPTQYCFKSTVCAK